MKTPGIIGTAPANARAEKRQVQAIGGRVGDQADGQAREQRGDFHAQVIETEIAETMADHAAQDRHPQDPPRRVVERTEPASGHAGQRHIQRQREWHRL